MPLQFTLQFFILIVVVLITSSSCASVPFKKITLNNRTVYVNEHPNLKESIKDAILKGKVIIGMSFEDVRAVWGEPNEISTAENSKFLKEGESGWQYNRLFVVPIFVHFTNGIVADINDDYK